ncbi:hypothetical protein JTB14_015355 [Gonioctena quinquepunctata]|nr:hypothetical protein JTB14_015355 [Gonioctena quinquepunctata]
MPAWEDGTIGSPYNLRSLAPAIVLRLAKARRREPVGGVLHLGRLFKPESIALPHSLASPQERKVFHTGNDKEVEEDELNSTVVGNTIGDNVGDAWDLFMKTKHAMLSNLCTSKDSAGKKSEAIALVEQMHEAFLAVLDRQKKFIEQEPIVEALARIENRLADKVEEPKLPTYAEKARINAAKVRINRGRPMNTSNNQVILIYPNRENTDINSSEETLSKLKSRRPEDIGIRPEKLLPISGNGVKIIAAESTINEEELGKLGLIAKKLDKPNPRLAVIGVPNSVMDREIEEEIGLRKGSPGEVKARYKYGKRNGKDKVWVIETNAETRDRILRNGRVSIGWIRCGVRDHVRVIRCYRCQKYGHVASNCRSPLACSRCAGEHDTRNCESRSIRCVNCYREGAEIQDHEATSFDCPTYQRKVQSHVQNTDYGG